MTQRTGPTEPPPVFVDPRSGSRDLYDPLRALGLRAEYRKLESADFAFEGLGPGFRPAKVGIERKRLSDLLSCIEDGRYASTQLPRLHRDYPGQVWLFFEGIWRASPDTGLLEVPRGRDSLGQTKWEAYDYGGVKTADQVRMWLLTIAIKGGVRVEETAGPNATADRVARLWRWWNCNDGWEGHVAHRAIDAVAHYADHQYLVPLEPVGEVASRFPGIGSKLCRVVQDAFETVEETVNASVKDWAKVSWESARGRRMRLGTKTAADVWTWLRTRKDGTLKV